MSQVVLITGASAGIGKETAKHLIREGFRVYVAARRLEPMHELEELGATAIKVDVTKDEDCVGAINQIKQAHGGVNILINNAGFGVYGAVEDTPLDDARYQFEVNLFGVARLTQLVLPYMRDKRAGKIVNISSMGGKIYTPLGAWYHATKHALEGWSDCLRLELKAFGIDVIIVEPGIIESEFPDIMLEAMMARSGSGQYQDLARKIEKMTRGSYKKGKPSPSSVVAETITKALQAKKPKTRYACGKLARTTMTARRWLPDRAFDYAIMNAG